MIMNYIFKTSIENEFSFTLIKFKDFNHLTENFGSIK